MQTVSANGAELAYVEQGTGAPVVFVHGSLEDYRSWRFQMDPFAQHYHVVAYSRRFHYPNAVDGGGRDYTAALHADDLAALLEALGLGPAHFVCSSYGGYVALYLAARHPDLVRSLVLGEPPLMPWLYADPAGAPLAQAFNDHAWARAREAFGRGDADGGVRLFLNSVVGRDVFDRLSPGTRAMPMANAAAMAAETRSPDYFSPFTCADAGLIDRPALVLDGEHSPRLFYLITEELVHCLPRAGHNVVPQAAHAMHLDNPEFYNEAVLAFLALH